MKNSRITKLISIIICVCFVCLSAGCANSGRSAKGLVKDAVLSQSSYKLGDKMGDYTVTDVMGNTYTFSELLKEKKAIVLNFWFIDCMPCQMEFPNLQNAYDEYSDDVAVIAINPVDNKETDIQKFANNNSITLPMVAGESDWVTAFNVQGFPTTVVIDRYGNIAFSHVGTITEEGIFEKIFEFFTRKNYKKTTINNIEELM